jgi:hypothetical protein
MKYSYLRGHKTIWTKLGWVYADDHSPADMEHLRPCAVCGAIFQGSDVGGPDPCLGDLPGVDNACCGHGVPSQAYIRFTNGVTVRGFTEVDGETI